VDNYPEVILITWFYSWSTRVAKTSFLQIAKSVSLQSETFWRRTKTWRRQMLLRRSRRQAASNETGPPETGVVETGDKLARPRIIFVAVLPSFFKCLKLRKKNLEINRIFGQIFFIIFQQLCRFWAGALLDFCNSL
jgi:hypothetical protein